MELTLKTKANGIEKVYTTQSYELDFGTIEDFLNIIDVNKIDNNVELMKMVFQCMNLLKPLVHKIFKDITNEEIRSVSLKEMTTLFINVFTFTFNEFGLIKSKN